MITKKYLERLGFVCKENFLSFERVKISKNPTTTLYTHLCNLSSALRHLSPGTGLAIWRLTKSSSNLVKQQKFNVLQMYFLLEKGWVFFAMLVCWSVTTSKQRPSEPRFTPCMYLSQIHWTAVWVAQHSTPTCFPFQKPGRSCRRLPCGSPSAKADARCPVAVWFLAFLNAYKILPKPEKAPTKTQPAIFPRASRAKAKKVSQMANIFFWGGEKTGRLHQFFLGSKRSCVFSKGFKCMEIPFPGWNFPLASSQVSMAAEMDSAPQGICHDENHHFLENWVNLYCIL